MRRLVALALMMSFVLMLAFLTDAAAGEKKKKKKGNAVKGTIAKVERGTDGTATLTIKTKAKKGQEGKEVKLEIAKDTKIEKAVGKKKDKTPPVASEASALEQGQLISAQLRSGSTTVADKVLIAAKKKKKNT